MKVVITKHFPFGKFVAINMFARLYLKDKDKSRLTLMIRYPNRYFKLIQHERSHTKQQNDLLGIFFYVWYVIEWFFKLFTEGKAYRELCFEREARANETNVDSYMLLYITKMVKLILLCKIVFLFVLTMTLMMLSKILIILSILSLNL